MALIKVKGKSVAALNTLKREGYRLKAKVITCIPSDVDFRHRAGRKKMAEHHRNCQEIECNMHYEKVDLMKEIDDLINERDNPAIQSYAAPCSLECES